MGGLACNWVTGLLEPSAAISRGIDAARSQQLVPLEQHGDPFHLRRTTV